MAKARSTLAAVLLLLWTATPALRCLVPGETLTAAEQACCKAMGEQCGESSTANHPCCKPAHTTIQPALATAQAVVIAPGPVSAEIPSLVQSLPEQTLASDWLVDTSPPPELQLASPVLRI